MMLFAVLLLHPFNPAGAFRVLDNYPIGREAMPIHEIPCTGHDLFTPEGICYEPAPLVPMLEI